MEKDYRRIGYRRVRQIAIDETHLGRTRKFITLVMDMESARIIWVGEGRGGEALREFWRRFKLSGASAQSGGHGHERSIYGGQRASPCTTRDSNFRPLSCHEADERTSR